MSKPINNIEQTKAELETQLRQARNHAKMLKRQQAQEERRARTHRLIEHGAVLESVFPAIRTLTAEETKTVLKKLSKIPAVQETMEVEKRSEDEGEITGRFSNSALIHHAPRDMASSGSPCTGAVPLLRSGRGLPLTKARLSDPIVYL